MDRQFILSQLKTLRLDEAELRLALIDEAITWIGTPYHTNADIKGVGVDCGMILIRIFSAVGAIEFFDPRPYPEQWAFTQKMELYLQTIQRFAAQEVTVPLPGDVVVFKISDTGLHGHGALVTSWPDIIHANPPGNCREDNCIANWTLRRRTPRFFSRWAR
jgi:cell wall-associated NlpC family hydrolase